DTGGVCAAYPTRPNADPSRFPPPRSADAGGPDGSVRLSFRAAARPSGQTGTLTRPSSKRRPKRSPGMQPAAVDMVPLAGTVANALSLVGLFLQSDAIVKTVMLILLVASFWSWAVIFDKVIRLWRLRDAAASFEESFWSGGSLD